MLLIPAPAKVNLCLALRGRRDDGFHDIDSVVVTIDWHDLVGIRLRRSDATATRLRVTGDTGSLPPDDGNLASLAARAVAAVAGPAEIDVWLDKRVPSAAGLGGGSADAAAVLRGCASLLRGSAAALDDGTLLALAASLGSDVPMLVRGGAVRARGRGDQLTALTAPSMHIAVAVVGESATAATYAAVETFDFEDDARSEAVAAGLAEGKTPADDLLGSGLEPAACRANPSLDERLLALRAALPEVRWHLTGSGGAAFAVAGDAGHARDLAERAAADGFAARACRTISG